MTRSGVNIEDISKAEDTILLIDDDAMIRLLATRRFKTPVTKSFARKVQNWDLSFSTPLAPIWCYWTSCCPA